MQFSERNFPNLPAQLPFSARGYSVALVNPTTTIAFASNWTQFPIWAARQPFGQSYDFVIKFQFPAISGGTITGLRFRWRWTGDTASNQPEYDVTNTATSQVRAVCGSISTQFTIQSPTPLFQPIDISSLSLEVTLLGATGSPTGILFSNTSWAVEIIPVQVPRAFILGL